MSNALSTSVDTIIFSFILLYGILHSLILMLIHPCTPESFHFFDFYDILFISFCLINHTFDVVYLKNLYLQKVTKVFFYGLPEVLRFYILSLFLYRKSQDSFFSPCFLTVVVQLFQQQLFKKTILSPLNCPRPFIIIFNNFQVLLYLCGHSRFYHIIFFHLNNFNVSSSTHLLVMNFRSFCLSEKPFISPSFREVFSLCVEFWAESYFLPALPLHCYHTANVFELFGSLV